MLQVLSAVTRHCASESEHAHCATNRCVVGVSSDNFAPLSSGRSVVCSSSTVTRPSSGHWSTRRPIRVVPLSSAVARLRQSVVDISLSNARRHCQRFPSKHLPNQSPNQSPNQPPPPLTHDSDNTRRSITAVGAI